MNRTTVRLLFCLIAGALLFAGPAIAKNQVINGSFELGNTQFQNEYWSMNGFDFALNTCDIEKPNKYPGGIISNYAFWANPCIQAFPPANWQGYLTQQVFVEKGRTYSFNADVLVYNC